MSITACHRSVKSSQIVVNNNCYTGKLVIKGICGQRVIEVIDYGKGQKGKLSVDTVWINPGKGEKFYNVFSVQNMCDFPSAIDQGDTFSFRIADAKVKDCMNCMAYIAVPDTGNTILAGCNND
jgi:hypothetical protein